MADPRFFKKQGPFALSTIIETCEIDHVKGAADGVDVTDIRPLMEAESGHLSFLSNVKYKSHLKDTKASAVFVDNKMAADLPAGVVGLVSKNPHRSYAIATRMFYGNGQDVSFSGIHPTACISETAEIGEGTSIGPFAVIGDGVVIGDNCCIESHVTITHAKIGNNVRVFPGARIGQSGFGYAMDPRGHMPVPQLGRVIIGDHVEIGANTTIDRGSWKDTEIGDGCVIDNLVMLGHNVKMGRGCVIVAQTGISGSTTLGDFVVTAGQSGFVGHIEVGSGVRVGAQAGVTKSIPAGAEVSGTPAVPLRQYLKQAAVLGKLTKKSS